MKIQTRRSVSLKAEVFVRLARTAEAHNRPVASLLESYVEHGLDLDDAPLVSREEALVSLGRKRQTCCGPSRAIRHHGRPSTRLARCTEVAP